MTRFAWKYMIFAASSLALLGIAPAHAGEDTARAQAYFSAITGGDPETIASYYADDAEFRWVGGPLAGLYKGKDKIKGVWQRFTAAAGKFSHEVLELDEINSGTSTVVTAKVRFKGDGDVPVKFAITYRDGKIVSETWQVDKAGVVARQEPKAGAPEAAAQAETQHTPGIRPETIATVQIGPDAAAAEPARQSAARELKPQTVAKAEPEAKPEAAAAPQVQAPAAKPEAEAATESASKPEAKPQPQASVAPDVKPEATATEIQAKPEAAQAARQPASQPKPDARPAAAEKPANAAVVAAEPKAAEQTATAEEDSRPDYLPKNATSGGKSGKAGSTEAKPAAEAKSTPEPKSAAEPKSTPEAKSAPKAKVAKKAKAPRRRIDVYEDEDDGDYGYGYGYGYGGYRRSERYYEPRGYYGDYRGYRGYGYGRYGYGY